MSNQFSIRDFLRTRKALLVHFSTVMARSAELVFPDDLTQAMHLRGTPLSFSTIEVGDTCPNAGRGGAEGSIGLLVDLGSDSRVVSVSPGDSGSYYDERTGSGGSLGLEPTAQNCADSIDKRQPSNEWIVENYIPLGIYILPPIRVRQSVKLGDDTITGEVEISLYQAIAPFPEWPIYSANEKGFLKYDRQSRAWNAVGYDDIIGSDCSQAERRGA